MNNLIKLPREIDQTTVSQKAVAVAGIVATGLGLYWLLPPLVVILTNLWITIGLGVPLVILLLFIVNNPYLIWNAYKSISWKLTQKYIGLDLMGQLDRYLEWMDYKIKVYLDSKKELEANLMNLNKQIADKERIVKENLQRASASDGEIEKASYAIKASNAKKSVENLIPVRDKIEFHAQYVGKLAKGLQINREGLKDTIDTTKQEFTALTSANKALSTAAAISGDSEAVKMYNETLNQIAGQVNYLTTSIQEFEENFKPMLMSMETDRKIAETEGLKLLQAFEQNQFTTH